MGARQVSAADQWLIDELRGRRVLVTGAQLERWRQAGCLPRRQRHGAGRGRGTRSVELPDTVDQAAVVASLLARRGPRGVPLRRVPLALFALGFPVEEQVLKAAFRRFFLDWEKELQVLRATSGRPIEDRDAEADLLTDRVSRRPRGVQRTQRARLARTDRSSAWSDVVRVLFTIGHVGEQPTPEGLEEAMTAVGVRTATDRGLIRDRLEGMSFDVLRDHLDGADLGALKVARDTLAGYIAGALELQSTLTDRSALAGVADFVAGDPVNWAFGTLYIHVLLSTGKISMPMKSDSP